MSGGLPAPSQSQSSRAVRVGLLRLLSLPCGVVSRGQYLGEQLVSIRVGHPQRAAAV